MAQYAAGAGHRLCYKVETTWGTTVSGAGFKKLRHTSCNLDLQKDAITSQEIRSDRQTADLRHGVKRVSGDIAFELSYGNFDDFIEAVFFGTWATNTLKAAAVRKSFSIERGFTDQATPSYGMFSGCMLNSMSLSLRPNAMVTGSFGFIGKVGTYSTSSTVTSPSEPDYTNSPYDTFSGAIVEGGSAIASVTSLDFSMTNNLDPNIVIGTNMATGVTAGRVSITGTAALFFEDLVMMNKFINETSSSLKFTLGGAEGATKTMTWLFPKIKYSGGSVPVSGDGPITLNMPFTAIYDGTTELTALKLTRVP